MINKLNVLLIIFLTIRHVANEFKSDIEADITQSRPNETPEEQSIGKTRVQTLFDNRKPYHSYHRLRSRRHFCRIFPQRVGQQ